MKSSQQRLPLTALRSFEAAARLLSFKAAAEELRVTPTSVSNQIRPPGTASRPCSSHAESRDPTRRPMAAHTLDGRSRCGWRCSRRQ